VSEKKEKRPKILIIATEACAYPAANAVGQAHMEYSPATFVLRVRAPVMFPEEFYLKCFEKGIDGIIIMSCGVECPYKGAYEQLAARIDKVQAMMKERGISPNRLVLTAVCTVCTRSYLEKIARMDEFIRNEWAKQQNAGDGRTG